MNVEGRMEKKKSKHSFESKLNHSMLMKMKEYHYHY